MAYRKAGRGLCVVLALGTATMASGGDIATDAARRTADTALAQHDPVRAEVVIRQAMAQTHAEDALRAWLAEALMQENDRKGALSVLDAGACTPDSAELGWRVRGEIALADGHVDAATEAFDQALRIAPNDADLWVSIAATRFTAGEHAQAEAAADHAVALDPNNPHALAMRGMMIREQFGLAAALPWFEAALLIHPDDAPLLDAYASTLGDLGQYRAMLVVARKLADVDPKSQRPRLMEAVLAARAGQTDLARSILQRTGPAFRDMPAAMLLSGVLDYRAGNYPVAIETLERLIAAQPDNRVAVHVLARALAANGNWRRLANLLDGDVAAGRAEPDLVALAGTAWNHLDDQDKGDALLTQAKAMTGRPAGAALASSGTVAVLASHYADNPRSVPNAVAYIRALIAAQQAGTAQPLADRLRDQYPGNADARMLAGDVRMIRGDAHGALVDYGRAATIRFNEALLVRMDAALRAVGHGREADGLTSRYLAQNPQSAVAMTLLAAAWATNPARKAELVNLRKAMLARGAEIPSTAAAISG